jgi:hypothetical protein
VCSDHPQPPAGGKRYTQAAVLLIVAAAVAGWWGLSLPPDHLPPAVPLPEVAGKLHSSAADSVGSTACARCHAEIAAAYAQHPMARSTRRVTEDEWNRFDPCAPSVVPGRQRVLAVDCDGHRLVHHERMYDAAGRLIYDLAFPLEYVVGSGERAKAYLHRRGDLLFMSPLNWYRASGAWDLAPGYVPDDVRRFDRRVTDACLACHAGRVVASERGPNIVADPVFHETSIGCERCHGPGGAHIAWHDETPPRRTGKDPIIHPGRLDQERRESICYQCHLSAAARVLRPGRSHFDFRPGMRLVDVWAILDVGTDVTADGRTRSVNHVQQMRDSRCYRESGGTMGCTSCHDPHRVPAAEDRTTYYRQRCLVCHAEGGCALPPAARAEQRDSCIACHMPARESSHMDHVAQTDHRILRRPLAAEEGEDAGGSGRLEFFGEMEAALSPEERDRARGLGTFIALSRKGVHLPPELGRFLEQVLAHFPNDVTMLTVLGTIARQQNQPAVAREYYERAVAAAAHDEAALDGLLEVSYQMSDWLAAVECANRLLAIDPQDARVHAIRGDALLNLGRVEEGIAAVRRAAELNPGAVLLHAWLATQFERLGREDQQRRADAMLERIQGARVPEALSERRATTSD